MPHAARWSALVLALSALAAGCGAPTAGLTNAPTRPSAPLHASHLWADTLTPAQHAAIPSPVTVEPLAGPILLDAAAAPRTLELDPVEVRQRPHELVASCNADVPPGAGFQFQVRLARRPSPAEAPAWGPYFTLLTLGSATPPTDPNSAADKLDIDTLETKPFDLLQVRLCASSGLVAVRNIIVTTSEDPNEPKDRWTARERPSTPPVVLPVPFRSQRTSRPELAGRLCSPTSLSMVLAYQGLDLPVLSVAQTAYDTHHDVYGNWTRNIQAAYSLGRPGLLVRFDSWPNVFSVLRAGFPIVVSIRVEPGQLRGAPFKSTEGHLIVVRGYTAEGDLLVSDPSVSTPEKGELVYRQDDMTQVWFKNAHGTAYVLLGAPHSP